jgi:hypothetical protein
MDSIAISRWSCRRRSLPIFAAISPGPAGDPLQHLDEFIPRRPHDVGRAINDLLLVSGEGLDPLAFIEGVAAENLAQAGIASHYGQSCLDQQGMGLVE